MLKYHSKHTSALCITEHWLTEDQIKMTQIPGFYLAGYFCRKVKHTNSSHTYGGTCIYLANNINSKEVTEFKQITCDSDMECSIVEIPNLNIFLISIYRAPNGDLHIFLKNLEIILDKLSKRTHYSIIICGDININFLSTAYNIHEKDRNKLINLVRSYNLDAIIDTPTRQSKNTQTAIDQIFLDKTKHTYTITTNDTGLSDHNAQILTLQINSTSIKVNPIKETRKFNAKNLNKLITMLTNESWSGIYEISDINLKFNTFFNTIKHHFNISHPLQYHKTNNTQNSKAWITKGIKISCERKRELHTLTKQHSCNQQIVSYYKRYSAILKKVIIKAKQLSNDEYIKKSKNKTKAMWNIVKKNLNSK